MKHFTLLLLLLTFLNLSFYVFPHDHVNETTKSCNLQQKELSIGPCSNIFVHKMNIFYAGVTNPITISTCSENSTISSVGCELESRGNGKYDVRVKHPGHLAIITITNEDSEPTEFRFRIKRIPDPTPCIANCRKNIMSANELKGQEGIYAKLENMDIDIRFLIQSFQITRFPSKSGPIQINQKGGRFSHEATELINLAEAGDIFLFSSIKAKGPGEQVARDLSDLFIRVR